jgi:hypothetical protein
MTSYAEGMSLLSLDPAIYFFRMDAPQSFTILQALELTTPDPPAPKPALGVAAGLLTSDGRIDVACVRSPEAVQWCRQGSADLFEVNPALITGNSGGSSTGISAIDSGKLGRMESNPAQLDARVDLAVTLSNGTRAAVLLNTGFDELNGNWLFQPFLLGVTPNPNDQPGSRRALVTDLNGDGLPDVITANRGVSGVSDPYEGFSVLLNRND